DSHAASTGTVTPRITACASSYVTRGRRRHTRHVESVTLPSCTSGNCRNRNVFTPRIVPANLSVMYRFIHCTIDTPEVRTLNPMNYKLMWVASFSFYTSM